ncbi:hypothetical protein GCM10027452_01180 [Micromonospora halotolerans]
MLALTFVGEAALEVALPCSATGFGRAGRSEVHRPGGYDRVGFLSKEAVWPRLACPSCGIR